MAGGKLQWPIWKPYEIYAAIDYVYGWPGWNDQDGFGGGQGAMNTIEAVLYGLYLMILYNHGSQASHGRGVQVGQGVKGWLSGGVKVSGKIGNIALMIGFSASVMTFSKTVLYCRFNLVTWIDSHIDSFKTLSNISLGSRTQHITTGSRLCSFTAS